MSLSTATLVLALAGLNRSPVSIIGVIILILDILVVVSVVAGKGSPAHKAFWSLIVFFLPLIGLILYFVFGRSRADRPLME